MVKNWICGICIPRPTDSGGESDDDGIIRKHNQNDNERLMNGLARTGVYGVDDLARAGVYGGDGEISSGTKKSPRKSPNEGKSDEKEIDEATLSKVSAASEVTKKKSGKKRNRGGGGGNSEKKKEHQHPRTDSDDGVGCKVKEKRDKSRKSSKEKDFEKSDQRKHKNLEEKVTLGEDLSSPEKKDKKKKKKSKKKKKKEDKDQDQDESTHNAVDEKGRQLEGMPEDKEIGSLNESFEPTNDASEQRMVEKSSTNSNDARSSEFIKLPAATNENHIDTDTEDGNNYTTIRNEDERSLPNSGDDIQSHDNNELSNDDDDESLNPDEIIFENKSLSDVNCDNDSLEDTELFDVLTPNPRTRKQFLDAALTAKSLSDLNYAHVDQASKTARRKSLTDLKFDDDNSLGDEVFELDEPIIPRPKKQFLEAALMAKSLSDLNFLYSDPGSNTSKASRRKSLTDLKYDDDNSLGDEELFKLHPPSPRPKKQFLDAAMAAKSISDLNFVYSRQAPEVTTNKDCNHNYSNDSLEDLDLFPSDEPIIPRPKKQFLEAALMAKSLSDLNYVHSDPNSNTSKASRRKSLTDLKHDDDNSLGDEELFKLHPPSPRPKKQFLEAAMAAKSISDLNFVYSAQAPEVTRSQNFDGDFSNDSLDDVQLFEHDEPIPRPKKQFLDAALAAKSISDLNFVYSAQVPEVSTSIDFDGNCSQGSLDDVQLFDVDEPVPRPKKQFLDAAMAAKSISDLNFVYSNQAPEVITIEESDDDTSTDSLDDVELFEHDEPSPRPKKQFLDAALTAKSISDLNFVYSAQEPELTTSEDCNGNSSTDSLDDVELFELDEASPRPKKQFLDAALTAKSISDLNYVFSAQAPVVTTTQDLSEDLSNDLLGELFELDEPILRPKKQFLEAALMAKSLSDLNYVHSGEVPKMSRRKSLTDLNDDDRSLGDDDLFELHSPPRPKKQFLEAALMAKSISDLRCMDLVSSTVSNPKDSESKELEILKESERICPDTSDIFGETEGNDDGVESK